MSPATLAFFASAPAGTESALADELQALGAARIAAMPRGVAFEGSLEVGYRAVLWSRVASRVLLRLSKSAIESEDALYDALRAIDWSEQVNVDGSIAVEARSSAGSAVPNVRFLAQRVKDAVVDQFRERLGRRPDVDLERPDLRIHVHLGKRRGEISIDLSGSSLHRRGYRAATGPAPIKENVAAAILLRAGWPELAAQGQALLDPLCGSGTFLCEAFGMLSDLAPGLHRSAPALTRWKGHVPALWETLCEEARQRHATAKSKLTGPVQIWGADRDARVLDASRYALESLGALAHVSLVRGDLVQMRPPAEGGVVVANPPWGHRMGEITALESLYAQLGASLREHFCGWKYAILTGTPKLGAAIGIYAPRRYKIDNGKIPCQLLVGEVEPRFFVAERRAAKEAAITPDEALANRLRKRASQLQSWVAREHIDAYRIYDADLPEYALAIDRYGEEWVVQEYAAPREIPPEKAKHRLHVALATLQDVFGVHRDQIFLRRRVRQRGKSQYEKVKGEGVEREIGEGDARFIVNLSDYLDTGIFLDHRIVRQRVAELSRGRSFLNLFCYTATATVQAALAGAQESVSVDLSATYLDWAARNFQRNGIRSAQHRLIRADCRAWLDACERQFDVIFLDPPTFSNSKRMDSTFDVQRDHVSLVESAIRCLRPLGELIFSCNARRFRLDPTIIEHYHVEDWTHATTPPDFARKSKVHHCFRIMRRDGDAVS